MHRVKRKLVRTGGTLRRDMRCTMFLKGLRVKRRTSFSIISRGFLFQTDFFHISFVLFALNKLHSLQPHLDIECPSGVGVLDGLNSIYFVYSSNNSSISRLSLITPIVSRAVFSYSFMFPNCVFSKDALQSLTVGIPTYSSQLDLDIRCPSRWTL